MRFKNGSWTSRYERCDTWFLEANEKLWLHVKFVGSQPIVGFVHVVYVNIAPEALLQVCLNFRFFVINVFKFQTGILTNT